MYPFPAQQFKKMIARSRKLEKYIIASYMSMFTVQEKLQCVQTYSYLKNI
jgi:hypothetical protein